MSLKSARIKAGLGIIEAANLLHVTRATLFNWERGFSSPRLKEVERILEVYECDIAELLESRIENDVDGEKIEEQGPTEIPTKNV